MILLHGVVYLNGGASASPRAVLVLILVTVWALRFSIYIIRRNQGLSKTDATG